MLDQDTSPEFQAFCQQAKERGKLPSAVGCDIYDEVIVPLNPPQVKRVLEKKQTDVGLLLIMEREPNHFANDCVKLPSTTQLLGMLPKKDEPAFYSSIFLEELDDLLRWTRDPWGYGSMPFPRQGKKLIEWRENYIPQFKTLQQLLLAYVMWELHDMRWDGKEWR
jgi:hypothetical protein